MCATAALYATGAFPTRRDSRRQGPCIVWYPFFSLTCAPVFTSQTRGGGSAALAATSQPPEAPDGGGADEEGYELVSGSPAGDVAQLALGAQRVLHALVVGGAGRGGVGRGGAGRGGEGRGGEGWGGKNNGGLDARQGAEGAARTGGGCMGERGEGSREEDGVGA